MSSPKKDENLEKKFKDLEDKFDLLDEKILVLFDKIGTLTDKIDSVAEIDITKSRAILEEKVLPPEDQPPVEAIAFDEIVEEAEEFTMIACPSCGKFVKSIARYCSGCGLVVSSFDGVRKALEEERRAEELKIMAQPTKEPVKVMDAQVTSVPLRKDGVIETVQAALSETVLKPTRPPRPPREPFKIIDFFKNEENVPYLLLFAFFILLTAIVYGIVSYIVDLPFFTPLNAFLITGLTSCAFTLLGLLWKISLDRRKKKFPEKEKMLQVYQIFPWSFLGIGTAGIFLSFILSQTVIEGALSTAIVLPIAVVAALVAMTISIFFKNEFLVGEAALSLVLILLIPIIIDAPLIPAQYSGYLYFGFFFIFIAASYILAKLKITAAPSLVALISFPVFAFIPKVFESLRLESLLVVIPSCLVATLLLENAYDNFKIYNNKVMRTVITVVDFALPLTSYFFLIFMRRSDYAAIPSWEILISTTFLVVTYFLTIKQIIASRFEEYDIQNPNAVEFLYVLLINVAIFLSLVSELLYAPKEITTYVFLGLYLTLQIAFSILTMTWRVDRTVTTFTHNILSLLFVEGMFILFFTDVANVTSISLGYEIVMAISLAFLFLAPLINIFVLRKEEYVLRSAFSVILLGGINLFVFNYLQRIIPVELSIVRPVCELAIIVFSITVGIVALLDTLGKYKFGSQNQKLTSSHVHAISILSLTSSLWVFNTNEIVNYIVIIGIFVSATIWTINSYLRRKMEKSVTEDLLGYLAVSLIFIAITGAMSGIANPLAILTTILAVIMLTVIPLIAKSYNLLFALLLYVPQIVSLFAFPSVSTIYGADWLLPITFLVPTLALSIKSINNKDWYNRIGTVILVALMLILTSLSLAGSAYEILIVIDSFILIFYPIALYILNLWIFKKQSAMNVTIEYPIDLSIITLGAIVATFFISTTPISTALIFVFLLIGTVIGPFLYALNRFILKQDEIPSQVNRFVSAGFILAIQILLIATGALNIVTTYFYIALMLSTTLVGLLIQFKEKFDSLTILPSLITIMIIPAITTNYLPVISSWYTFSMFILYLIILALGWFGSKYYQATLASYFVGCLAFILSLFVPSSSFFIGLPTYFPLLLFTVWMIGVVVSIVVTKTKPETEFGFFLIWLFAITIGVISTVKIFEINAVDFMPGLLSFTLTAIPACLVFILFSTYLQYKMKYSNNGMISHIIAVQALLIYVGSMMLSIIPFPSTPQTAQMLTYIFFNVFTVIVFIILESLVIEYTLVKTDTPRSEFVNVILFVPIYIFSLVISIYFGYYGFIPMILGIVFYGMSQRHNMNASSVFAVISIALSAFFITPVSQILSWTTFGIVSGIMSAMIVVGILLYLKTKNEFHIITTVSVALIAEVIIGFMSPMSLPLQFGLAFNLALIGVLLGVIFSIREFQIIFNVAWALLLIPYLVLTFVISAGLIALLFLATGALMILASYLIYNNRKEKRLANAEATTAEKKE